MKGLVCMVCGSREYHNVSYGEFIPIIRKCNRCFTHNKFIEVDAKDVKEVSDKIFVKWKNEKNKSIDSGAKSP